MTYELFPSSPAPSEHPATDAQGYDIEGIMHQLMQETGCSVEEAGVAVMRQIEAKKKATTLPDVPYSKLRTEAERSAYMKTLRESTMAQSMDKHTREMYVSEQAIAAEQQAFAQRMRERSVSQGPMRSTQAVIDFFRNQK